ncbi:D-alanyl-D-alanine carboxypeptidase family protein [Acidomonas methanolica]|uniref:D-alanyl-D-alanine carboxypeptidase family protein n=1 Tax=Acidomonas methanolica TaxID=437 RepID=UPI00211A0ECD|nr:D-alanyl-D-alanine carboxypeptidase family protein [Acidomonas methanolica]MCQ9154456.1 D-alanyl-D-alanine carboxypeptidase [Acidomonas methanolica]
MAAGSLISGLVAARSAHAQYVGHLSSLVMDVNSGAVLSQNDADLQRYPASLTKLMTLYIAFKALRAGQITLDSAVPVSIHAATMAPSKLGLVPGTHFTVEQAILALVTKSANDAACALGEYLGGGDEVRFANIMTAQARALGMANTTFRNASGLPDPDQVTTARDLAILARHLITEFPEYYHYFGVPYFRFHGRMVPNHDPMLKTYAGADGLKTGYTDLAGHNLVTSAMHDNVRLIGVVLGARSNPQRSQVMTALMDQGFSDEGIAPMAPLAPLMVASSGRHHRHGAGAIMLARAKMRGRGHAHGRMVLVASSGKISASAPDEVAEAPSGPRRYAAIAHGTRHVIPVVALHRTKARFLTVGHSSRKKTSRHPG